MDGGLAEQIGTKTVAPVCHTNQIGRSPTVSSGITSIGRVGAVIKRVEDIVISIVLVLMLSPLLLCIAAIIKATSRGPVFFLQERRGYHGVVFRCLKFRTMFHAQTDRTCSVQTRHNDPRVTWIGRRLRRHSMDELPQLFNVILGQMSLVGPRPHALGTNINGTLIHEIVDGYDLRYQVRPGITGWAQVNGWRGILDTQEKVEERLAHDMYYIANWTPWLDLKILLLTFTCIFDSERAF